MPHKARAVVLTLIDAAIVVLGSAAVVIWLGGRTRFALLGGQVRLLHPSRAVIAAAVLALLRVAIGRLEAPLPSLPRRALGLDEERLRLERPEPVSRRIIFYAILAVLGSLIWVLPQFVHVRQVPDRGDPVFSAWRIAALVHQLVTDPRHLWDGNIFFPQRLTITYSDSLFLQSLLAAPFVIAHVDPLIAANVLMAISFPARGLAFFYAAWRVTGEPDAALAAALVGAWSAFYPQHYSQLELNWTMFVPLAIVMLLRMLAAPAWKTGLAFGAAIAAQCLACMYVAAMLAAFLLPFAFLTIVAWRIRPSLAVLRASAGAALVIVPVAVFLAVPYMEGRQRHGDRGLSEVALGSASPKDYGDAHFRLVSYDWQSRRDHPERELFPGSSSLLLGAVAIVPPLTPVGIATVVAGACAFDWSLGVRGLTYDDLYKRSAIYRGMRVPARFSALVDAALALLAAYGARRLLRLGRSPASRAAVCAVLCGFILFDLRMDPRLEPYLADAPSIYSQVRAHMVLAELPRKEHEIDYMYFSTRHWAHLLGGYSGFIPLDDDVSVGFQLFPDPEAIARLRRAGATHLTYNCAFEDSADTCRRTLRRLDANPALELVARDYWHAADVRLYRFKN